ncbi:MAG TPA: SpoIIE family protein phosphatase, partial [Crinalium sp.]
GQEGLERAQQIRPALIICDWMMPLVDGLEVCRQVKADANLSTTFLILLTARGAVEDRIKGLDAGADEFLSKPIEMSELQARVRAGLRLHQVNVDLQNQKRILETELAEASAYMRSLLPSPITGKISIESRFIPSRQLGGDCFDYFWLDPDYLVIYLLDVSGHGLGAALPSITLFNLLRSQSLPDVNFYRPHDVLRALNETFQMDSQNDKYFTIWYGVYNQVKRQLTYATGGHPPAILISPIADTLPHIKPLKTPGLPVGMLPEAAYKSDRYGIPPNSTLYIFSDGIYDFNQDIQPNSKWGLDAFVNVLAHADHKASPDAILQKIQQLNHLGTFEDDLSLLKVSFQ